MPLSPAQVVVVRRDHVHDYYSGDIPQGVCRFTKAELNAAISAMDAWVDANQASFNATLPNPFKAQATAAEKAALFMWVLNRRYRG